MNKGVKNEVRVIGAGSWNEYIGTVNHGETPREQRRLYGIKEITESDQGDLTVIFDSELVGATIADYHIYCTESNSTPSLLCILPSVR